MRSTLRRLLAFAALLAAPLAPAAATTYLAAPDEALVSRADLVVQAKVVEATVGRAAGTPSTDYRVEVERVVAGPAAGTTLVVNVPGGEGADGRGLKLWGVPAFTPGDRALLFLRENGDGSYRILHLALGSFRVEKDGDRPVAFRALAGAQVLKRDGSEEVQRVRDLARFTDWIADRANGRQRAADYFVDSTGLRQMTQHASFLDWGGKRIRWFEFDAGQRISWKANRSGQGGVPGGGFDDFSTAIGVWNGDGGSNVGYDYTGQTSASGALSQDDGVNSIFFGGQIDEDFDCSTGGVLAIGGPWFDPDFTGVYNGETFIRAIEVDIVTNVGLDCFFTTSLDARKAAQELFGHELGHTLGLGHSCGDDGTGFCPRGSAKDEALMRASIHDDARGARINDDDRGGIRALYTPSQGGGGGGGKVPKAPTTLVGTPHATTVTLAWADKSGNENLFHVEQRLGSGDFAEVGQVAANVKTFTVSGLQPATTYGFRVRASNGQGFSAYSNEITVKTLPNVPTAPGQLRADADLCDNCSPPAYQVNLTWQDRSSGETGFAVEGKTPLSGAFDQLAIVPANSTTHGLQLPVGVPYTFRVRALAPDGNSAYSNEASATNPGFSSVCTPTSTDLCLGGGRFRVEVQWRTGTGATGHGGAIADGSAQATGFFWFFDPANVELAVKVLDGTTINDFFWTFYGALSDVEYWITVTDLVTTESRTYHSLRGSVVGQADSRSLPADRLDGFLPAIPSPQCTVTTPVDTTAAPGVCIPGPGALCLQGGRFRVEVDFNAGGVAGEGTAVPFAGDQSGRFWFFGPDNVELLVKVLDGRAINGRFWVFYGALSDVSYTLHVADLETGKVRSYTNPQGNFCGRADTAAFTP